MKRAFVLACMGIGACFAPTQGLEHDDTARVTGRLVIFDRSAPDEGVVYLIGDANRPVVRAEADASGAFTFDAPSAGKWSFAAVAAGGLAAQGTWSLQPGGTTDVGYIFLLTSNEMPNLVDFRGLGLEEQRTYLEEGVTQSVVPTPDGVLVGAHEGVLRVSEDGVAKLVDPTPHAVPGASIDEFDTSLAGPCWATGWIKANDREFVLYDLDREKVLLREPLDYQKTRMLGAHCSQRGALVALARIGQNPRVEGLWFEPGAAAPKTVSLLPRFDSECSPFVLLDRDGAFVGCPESGSLSAWRAGDDSSRAVDAALSPLGFVGEDAVMSDENGWLLLELDTGERARLLDCPSDRECWGLWESEAQTLWVGVDLPGEDDSGLLWRVNAGTRAATEVNLSPEVRSLLLAASPSSTTPFIDRFGGLILARLGPEEPCFVLRVETGELWRFESLGFSYVQPAISPTGDLWLSQGDGILSAPPGKPLHRRTWMNAHRWRLFPDAAGVWYVRNDPRTTEYQLFFLENDAR